MTELDIHGPYYAHTYNIVPGTTVDEAIEELMTMYPDAEYIDEYLVIEIEPEVTFTQSGLRRI